MAFKGRLQIIGVTLVLILSLAFAFAVLTIASSRAANAMQWHMVTGDGYPPFTDSHAHQGGIFTEVVAAALAAVGDEMVLERRTWAKGYSDVMRHHFVGTFPYIKTPEREEKMLYSVPVFEMQIHLYGYGAQGPALDTVEALSDRHYCNPIGYADEPQIKRLVDMGVLHRQSPDSMKTCFELTRAGQVDFLVANQFLATSFIRSEEWPATEVRDYVIPNTSTTTLHVIASKDHPRGTHLLVRFNQGLNLIKENGVFKQIVAMNNF